MVSIAYPIPARLYIGGTEIDQILDNMVLIIPKVSLLERRGYDNQALPPLIQYSDCDIVFSVKDHGPVSLNLIMDVFNNGAGYGPTADGDSPGISATRACEVIPLQTTSNRRFYAPAVSWSPLTDERSLQYSMTGHLTEGVIVRLQVVRVSSSPAWTMGSASQIAARL